MPSTIKTYITLFVVFLLELLLRKFDPYLSFYEILLMGMAGLMVGRNRVLNKPSSKHVEVSTAKFDLVWISCSLMTVFLMFNETFGELYGGNPSQKVLKVLWLGPFAFFWGLRMSKALCDFQLKRINSQELKVEKIDLASTRFWNAIGFDLLKMVSFFLLLPVIFGIFLVSVCMNINGLWTGARRMYFFCRNPSQWPPFFEQAVTTPSWLDEIFDARISLFLRWYTGLQPGRHSRGQVSNFKPAPL